jgi:hypothetical protein
MMRLGIALRRSRCLRIGLAASLAMAVLAVLASMFSLKLLPPGLSARSHGAGARTQVLIDDRKESVLASDFDLDSVYDLDAGAVLAGIDLVSRQARTEIADVMGIPLSALQVSDPQDPIDPPLPAAPSASPYSVTLAPRPSIPILDIYVRAPTEPAARKLADASVAGLRDRLSQPGGFGLRVTQLGGGARVSETTGASMPHGLELFAAVFALGLALTISIDRMRPSRPVGRRAREVAS